MKRFNTLCGIAMAVIVFLTWLSFSIAGCAFLATKTGLALTGMAARHVGAYLAEQDQETAAKACAIAAELIAFIGYGPGDEGITNADAQTAYSDKINSFIAELAGLDPDDPLIAADLKDLRELLQEALKIDEVTGAIPEEAVMITRNAMEAFKEGIELELGREK